MATQFLSLSTEENVRAYLAEGKKVRRRNEVHFKIEDTLTNYPENFCVLNGGIVIVARAADVDDKSKLLTLTKPSIINGAQTQGVLKDVAARYAAEDEKFPEVFVTFEVIVTDSEALIAEVSIARNFQNDVQSISIAGSRGILEELEASMKKNTPDTKLRKSETDRADDFVDTEKLLQVIMALTPPEMFDDTAAGDRGSKAYTYSQKAMCLKDFTAVHDAAKDKANARDAAIYRFFLQIAPQAWELYNKWKVHQGFKGAGIRRIEREGTKIVEVPDGIIFPILASLSVFASKVKGVWRINQPPQLTDDELIENCVDGLHADC